MNNYLRKLIDPLSPFFRGRISRGGLVPRVKHKSLDNLIDIHFSQYSESNHPCRFTLTTALEILKNKPSVILETGSSAWGTNSSLLFDSYVNSFGGKFKSVDIRLEPMLTLRSICSTNSEFYYNDSVDLLRAQVELDELPDLVYLDSWDVNWLDSIPSAVHGFNEFLTILPCLKSGSLLLVDDTPKDRDIMKKVQPMRLSEFDFFTNLYGFPPGKGPLIKNFLIKNSIGKEIAHEYQLLWQF